jgi:hypothetical protein
MGYDITFHPISKEDLERYLFQVADTPSISDARARELAANDDDYQMIMDFYYRNFPEWLVEAAAQEKQGIPAFSSRFVRTAAALAGFKHPYWYCRGSALSFVVEREASLHALITPVNRIASGVLAGIGDCSEGLITENFSAGGFIADIGALRQELSRHSKSVDKVFDSEGHWALENAMNYAEQHRLGLIEAADVYVPAEGGGSKYENLRADFLDKTE